VYSVTITRDGRVSYAGKGFVRVRGVRTKQVPVADFQRLVGKIEQIGFFRLEPSYPGRKYTGPIMTDQPSVLVTVSRGNTSKTVRDYAHAPEKLFELEALIEEVANISKWVKLNEKAAGEEMDRAYR
jgi:hypothetical protein